MCKMTFTSWLQDHNRNSYLALIILHFSTSFSLGIWINAFIKTKTPQNPKLKLYKTRTYIFKVPSHVAQGSISQFLSLHCYIIASLIADKHAPAFTHSGEAGLCFNDTKEITIIIMNINNNNNDKSLKRVNTLHQSSEAKLELRKSS